MTATTGRVAAGFDAVAIVKEHDFRQAFQVAGRTPRDVVVVTRFQGCLMETERNALLERVCDIPRGDWTGERRDQPGLPVVGFASGRRFLT